MSITIYNAYKLKNCKDINDLFEFKNKIYSKIIEINKNNINDVFLLEIVNVIDDLTYFKKKIEDLKIYKTLSYNTYLNYDVFEYISNKFNQAKNELTYTENTRYDFSFGITFYLYNNEVYFRLISPQYINTYNQYFNDLVKENILEEFYYWNNSDKPDDILQEDWENRRFIWKNIIKNNHHNSIHIDFVYEIRESLYELIYKNKLVLKDNIISKDMRSLKIAKDYITNKWIKEVKNNDFDSIIKKYDEVQEYLLTKEGKEELKKQQLIIEDKLLNIDYDILKSKVIELID